MIKASYACHISTSYNIPVRRRIGIGTRRGYATFSCEPFGLEFESAESPADILEIFFTSSLVCGALCLVLIDGQ